MSMPPYLRFAENESIQNKIWSLRPRNPFCGLVSLETGSKIFAWANIIYFALGTLASLVLLGFFMFNPWKTPSHAEMMEKLKASNATDSMQDEWIEKMAVVRQSSATLCIVSLFIFIICAYILHISWQLKRAIKERDIPILKKCFLILLLSEIVSLALIDFESEFLWSRAFFVDLPVNILSIMGLVCVYSFITSLTNPTEYTRDDDDTSRIQYSV